MKARITRADLSRPPTKLVALIYAVHWAPNTPIRGLYTHSSRGMTSPGLYFGMFVLSANLVTAFVRAGLAVRVLALFPRYKWREARRAGHVTAVFGR